MSVSSSSSRPTHLIPIDPRVYCETMDELHSYITSSKRGYLTQAELFRYYRQRHNNAEIPYRLLGYRALLDLLSSDQRLFAIDLRREPAYVYSAVKLRQQKRERRRMFFFDENSLHAKNGLDMIEDGTSFSRQHHSANTLGEQQQQHGLSPDYVFFDHHVPLTEQNIHSSDEHEPIIEARNERSLTPDRRNRVDTNVWHTPTLDEQSSSTGDNYHFEESHEEPIQLAPKQFVSLPTVRLLSDIQKTTSSSVKSENQHTPVQRRILSQNDENKSSSNRDPPLLKSASPRLNRSISTSTTSLAKPYSFHLVDLYMLLFAVVVTFIFFGSYLYKIC